MAFQSVFTVRHNIAWTSCFFRCVGLRSAERIWCQRLWCASSRCSFCSCPGALRQDTHTAFRNDIIFPLSDECAKALQPRECFLDGHGNQCLQPLGSVVVVLPNWHTLYGCSKTRNIAWHLPMSLASLIVHKSW